MLPAFKRLSKDECSALTYIALIIQIGNTNRDLSINIQCYSMNGERRIRVVPVSAELGLRHLLLLLHVLHLALLLRRSTKKAELRVVSKALLSTMCLQ